MSNRNSHSGKSYSQRKYYQRAVAQTGYEQTADESLDFDNSDSTRLLEPANDDSIQKAPFSDKILDFCKEHIIGLIVTIISTIVIGIFSLLTINLNRESGEHSKDIENIKESVSELKKDVSSSAEIITNITIVNTEQSKDIDYLQKNLEKMDKEINKIKDTISK